MNGMKINIMNSKLRANFFLRNVERFTPLNSLIDLYSLPTRHLSLPLYEIHIKQKLVIYSILYIFRTHQLNLCQVLLLMRCELPLVQHFVSVFPNRYLHVLKILCNEHS